MDEGVFLDWGGEVSLDWGGGGGGDEDFMG